MSWTLARLGSRFSLLFEPHHRRLMHSALGRFLDQPLDLMVGIVEPDGTQRVMPFSERGRLLYNLEQFERLNSITFRGYSEHYRLRFEFNIHSVFYPQDEALCTMPAFYLEMRLSPAGKLRWIRSAGPTPERVKLFIRLERPGTQITATAPQGPEELAAISLAYSNNLAPRLDPAHDALLKPDHSKSVQVRERIVSLNPQCTVTEDGKGLYHELPVTDVGSGIKWRLVWAAHCGEPVISVGPEGSARPARFRYVKRLPDIDAVVNEAVSVRDDGLGHSRRFEKLIDQASLSPAERHIVSHSFHAFLSNTFWCDLDDPPAGAPSPFMKGISEWFSVWEGSCFFHSTVDVEYNQSVLYLALWPRLLALQLEQWPHFEKRHGPSDGSVLSHDMGRGPTVAGQVYPHDMPVEENADYLLMLQAYSHWTGDLTLARRQADFVGRLADYLIWTDRDASGFPSEGTANTVDDANAAMQYARKQTYLAVKRLAGLQAAGDLLGHASRDSMAQRCNAIVESDVPRIERQAWLGDHYAVCIDQSTQGLVDVWSGEALTVDRIEGSDAYSIYTGNGLLLPAMIGQPQLLDLQRLQTDLTNSARETLSPYGCGHSSAEPDNVWLSQNMWRDFFARYLGLAPMALSSRYWDLIVMSNTHRQSLGFIDTYVNNNLCFYPRGITSIGYMIAGPRLVIDRLAPGGTRIAVDPDRHSAQRWPLLPLADWKAGKIPTCVIDADHEVTIESEADPVIIRGNPAAEFIG